MKKALGVLAVTAGLVLASCGTQPAKQDEAAKQSPAQEEAVQEAKPEAQAEDFGKLGNEYLAKCRSKIQEIKDLMADIKANPEGRTSKEKLQLFNKIEIIIEDTYGNIGIYEMNHPDEGVRNAAMVGEVELMNIITEINLDAGLYQVAAGIPVDDAALDAQDKHFLADLIDDFKRSGVDKDEATREEIKKVISEGLAAEQEFNANIAAGTKTLKFTVEQLKGMPENFINAKNKDENGLVMVTTDYPDYFPIMQYADNEDVRKQMYMAAQNIANPENTPVYTRYLKAKAKHAKLLGYSNWADFSEAKMMIENSKNASDFLNKLIPISMKYAKRDAEVLLAKKKELLGRDDVEVEPWDRFYIPRLIRMEKFGYNPQDVEQYFEMQKVINGIFIVHEKIFGLKFEKVKRDDVWHESVMSYDVYADGQKIGEFELDLYPRPNKYKHFAMFTNVQGIEGRLPRMAIVGNFPEPVNGKSYIDHDNVQTLFHEFGHLINGILARDGRYVRYAGTNCQRDFVEVPSQFMEEYVWDPAILQLWATNDAGEPIPAELVEKMKKSDGFGKGLHVSRQLFLAKLSLDLYLQDPENFDHHAFEKQLEKEYSPWKSYEETHQIENFGHLVNYTSNYYTYMWSLTIAKDFYGYIMQNGGLMNPEIMGRYRDTVLKIGGNKSGNEMVKDFLGRELSLEEFEKYLND